MQTLSGKKQDDKGQIYAQTRLLKDIKEQLCLLNDPPQEESLDPIIFCDDDCNITGATAFIRDEASGNVITQYFDSSLQPTTSAPSGTPCSSKCPLDYELITKCYENINTCEKYTQILTFVFKGGIKEQSSVCWILPDGNITTDIPIDIRPCTENCNCNPKMESFLGNNSTLETFHKFSVKIPSCCPIEITTSAGTYVFESDEGIRHIEEQFDCPISDYKINVGDSDNPDCDLSKIRSYLLKKS